MSTRAQILVVDDEPINIRLIETTLRSEYDIISATNGFDAIRLAKDQPPDLIILDFMMPDLSGFDVCRVLKSEADFAEIPVIFLTGMDSADAESEGLKVGGIDYLTKPVNLDLLRLRVRNHILSKERNDLVRQQRDLLTRQNEELEEALSRIRRLEGVIPICMHCKSIRRDDTSWQQLENYISDHTDALFSHGICPSCLAEHYPDVKKRV
jgi:DNA-binding response OmpR family regulator